MQKHTFSLTCWVSNLQVFSVVKAQGGTGVFARNVLGGQNRALKISVWVECRDHRR